MDAKRGERTGDIWQARLGTARRGPDWSGAARQDWRGLARRGKERQGKAGTDYQQRRQQWH